MALKHGIEFTNKSGIYKVNILKYDEQILCPSNQLGICPGAKRHLKTNLDTHCLLFPACRLNFQTLLPLPFPRYTTFTSQSSNGSRDICHPSSSLCALSPRRLKNMSTKSSMLCSSRGTAQSPSLWVWDGLNYCSWENTEVTGVLPDIRS